jgi:hypothetical protein
VVEVTRWEERLVKLQRAGGGMTAVVLRLVGGPGQTYNMAAAVQCTIS